MSFGGGESRKTRGTMKGGRGNARAANRRSSVARDKKTKAFRKRHIKSPISGERARGKKKNPQRIPPKKSTCPYIERKRAKPSEGEKEALSLKGRIWGGGNAENNMEKHTKKKKNLESIASTRGLKRKTQKEDPEKRREEKKRVCKTQGRKVAGPGGGKHGRRKKASKKREKGETDKKLWLSKGGLHSKRFLKGRNILPSSLRGTLSARKLWKKKGRELAGEALYSKGKKKERQRTGRMH